MMSCSALPHSPVLQKILIFVRLNWPGKDSVVMEQKVPLDVQDVILSLMLWNTPPVIVCLKNTESSLLAVVLPLKQQCQTAHLIYIDSLCLSEFTQHPI